jgi:DNA-binding NtrC family response regulator
VLSVRPQIPVVIMSGCLRPEDETNARLLGIRNVIQKPTTVDEPANTLDRLLQQRETGDCIGPASSLITSGSS